MDAYCKYYKSNIRLLDGVKSFQALPEFKLFCLDGNLQRGKTDWKIQSDVVTVMVTGKQGQSNRVMTALLSNDTKYQQYDDKMVDIDKLQLKNARFRICELLAEKYKNTLNPFTLEFKGDKCVLSVEMNKETDGVFNCIMRGEQGEVMTTGEKGLRNMLFHCPVLYSFSFSSIAPECEKEYTVRKSRGEILREIAHYINRTIAFVSFLSDKSILEQYISVRGVLEVITTPDGKKVYKKVSPVALQNTEPFCIYTLSVSIDDIVREQM